MQAQSINGSAAELEQAVGSLLAGGPPLWLCDGPAPELSDDVGAVVPTSGSQGAPKKVVLGRAALLAAAHGARERLGIDVDWHLAVPSRYVAGLMVAVRAVASRRRVRDVGTDLAGLAMIPTDSQRAAISLVPTQLYRALGSPELSQRLSSIEAILVGGAPLASRLRRQAEQAGLRVFETYGMSETCGGQVWDGVALPGTQLQIVPDTLAPEGHGRIAIGGPALFQGYWHESGISGGPTRIAGRELVLSADWGRLIEGRLHVGGRLDDIVITGGLNVDLAQVRRAVQETAERAEVLAVPDAEWGTRIVVVSAAGSLASWRDQLAGRLPRAALPRQHVLLAELPTTASGKTDRQKLLALVES